jgi:hypothetical protein
MNRINLCKLFFLIACLVNSAHSWTIFSSISETISHIGWPSSWSGGGDDYSSFSSSGSYGDNYVTRACEFGENSYNCDGTNFIF